MKPYRELWLGFFICFIVTDKQEIIMPRGDSLKRYWEAYRRGEVELGENHGKRGPDKPETVRAIGDNRTLQQRLSLIHI